MGAIWLRDLPAVLEAAGLAVDVWPGWENRARSSGGYDAVRAVFVHHTASNTAPANDMSYMWDASGGDQPIGAIYLGRDGRLTVGAAGATNTQGKGGPWNLSTGTIPLDKGNAYGIAIEAANAGTGEPWPAAQVDAYVRACRALCHAYGLDPSRDVLSHWEWCAPSCPGRKIDPAGPSPYAAGASSWDMAAFRRDVAELEPEPPTPLPPEPEPPTPEPPTPTPPTNGDFMADLPTIKKGDSGEYVERMQHLLAAAGFMDPANVKNYDGVWGNGTDGAKQRFDVAHGLNPSPPTDCGVKSWESLITGRVW